MKLPSRLKQMRPVVRALLILTLCLLAVIALFDWNWLRPGIERYLTHTSKREVKIGDLQVRFSSTLAPTVRLRNVYVQNAPWADARPLARIGEVSFSFASLATLLDDERIVSRLILIDAEVDLERQADDLRNWRLREPDNRGPGKYKVLRLEAHRSHVRFVHHGLDLELTATAMPASPGTSAPVTGEHAPLPNHIVFEGTYAGAPFSGDVLTSETLTFQQTREFFALRGQARSGTTRVELDGRVADFLKLGGMDAKLRLSGASLAQLHPFLRARLPASHPYQAEGHLSATPSEFALDDFRAKLGQTDIAGKASITRGTERHFLRARLRSELAHLDDLTSLSRTDAPAVDGKEPTATTRLQAAATSTPADRVFSHRPFSIDGLKANDASMILEVAKVQAPDLPTLESLRVTAGLQAGVLTLKPLDLGVAGGHVMGQFTLDAQRPLPAASATLEARNLRLEKLLGRLSAAKLSGGAIAARASLTASGNSLAAMLGSANGALTAQMAGGRISNLLDAKLGLNGGKLLWLKLSGDRDISVHCAALDVTFRNGLGRSNTLLLDTAQTRTTGAATVNLRDEKFDLQLTPRAKQARLIALGSGIHAYGSFKHADYALEANAPPASTSSPSSPALCPAG